MPPLARIELWHLRLKHQLPSYRNPKSTLIGRYDDREPPV